MNKRLAFGALLRKKREARGLSQTALARRLGWPQATVSRVEQGRREATLYEAAAVAEAFHCTVSDLVAEWEDAPKAQSGPQFSPGLSAAIQDEDAALAQLARFGVRFFGTRPRPALVSLPLEETVLAALRFSNDPRVFEALPALLIRQAAACDWTRLSAGAYSLQLQNRLGMAVAAALQLKDEARGVPVKTWKALEETHQTLSKAKLDREEVVGPPPKTSAGRALLEKRTPPWLRFWHGLGAADMEGFKRCLAA